MSTTEAAFLFAGSLILTVTSSAVLSRRIEQLGQWLLLSESLLGIIAALGSDAPEISSSLSALRNGQHDLGLGIVFGSNILNLAALLGLSAILAGKVQVSRRTLYLNGGVAVGVMALTTVQLYGILSPLVSVVLIAAIMAVYVALTGVSPALIQRAARIVGLGGQLGQTVTDANRDAKKAETSRRPSYADILDVLPSLVCIILASVGLVRSSLVLGGAWKIPMAVLCTLILASLTSIPNVVTAVQLALRGRGSAVLSESVNSNTLNLIAGVSLPALILGRVSLSPRSVLSLWWLIGMTLLALGLSFVRGGLGRKSGVLLVSVYIVFALLMVFT